MAVSTKNFAFTESLFIISLSEKADLLMQVNALYIFNPVTQGKKVWEVDLILGWLACIDSLPCLCLARPEVCK